MLHFLHFFLTSHLISFSRLFSSRRSLVRPALQDSGDVRRPEFSRAPQNTLSPDPGIVKPWSQGWLIAAGAYPGFCSIKRLEVFLLPLDRMLVHRRSLPRNFVRFPQQIAGTHLYTWVERGTVRVKCLAQEHNTLSPARARTRTARSGSRAH